MKSFTGDFIWSSVEHGRAEEKFYEKEYYLKEDADKVIDNLQKEVLILRSYDKELNRTIVSRTKINFCPMCGRKLTEDK